MLPYGDQHRMGGLADAEPVSITTFMDNPPWGRMPVLRHGANGRLTDVVCGYLHSQDPLFSPDLRVFPPVFVVRPPAGTAAEWVRANIAFALEQTTTSPPEPARAAGVSRSVLDARFRQVLGCSPIRYLTDWRMHVAQDLLTSTDLGVLRVARRVGYDAEEAFSRAFKRVHGSSPSAWRAAYAAR